MGSNGRWPTIFPCPWFRGTRTTEARIEPPHPAASRAPKAKKAPRHRPQPPAPPTRNVAILQAAMYDAIDNIDHANAIYKFAVKASPNASKEAAASEAAYQVMVALYPDQKSRFKDTLSQTLSTVPHGASRAQGIARWAKRSPRTTWPGEATTDRMPNPSTRSVPRPVSGGLLRLIIRTPGVRPGDR